MKFKFFDTGYCLNIEKFVSWKKKFRIAKFYALVCLIEHPDLGPILFDTGYSSHVIDICKRFPYFIYKMITPIRFEESLNAANQIRRFGYQPQDVKHIIISHFHPDHIGGLKDFPNATFHYYDHAYSSTKKAFFPDLIPHDFVKRSKTFNFENPISLPYKQFQHGADIFGDKSIIAVDLSGHAHGQIGILLNHKTFLCADACWQSDNYKHLEFPPFISRIAISDYKSFCKTLHKLHDLHMENPDLEILPTHCEKVWEKYAS